MAISSDVMSDLPPATRPRTLIWLIGVFALLPVVLALLGAIIGGAIGGELIGIASGALQSIPFMVLAVLGYLGLNHVGGRVSAVLWLLLILGVGALGLLLTTSVSLFDISVPSRPSLTPGAGPKLAILFGGTVIALIVASLGFIPAVRRAASRVLPLDPDSFVHMLMLVAAIGLTLLCFVPLMALGEPVLLALLRRAGTTGADLTGARGQNGQLRDTLYGLVWLVPATMFAVGYGVQRDWRATLVRLGLVRPTLRQVGLGLGVAVAGVVVVGFLSAGIDWVWTALGWPKTDSKAFGELLSFAMSPIGALVIGLTAGLGEELAVRGVLQPRAGIVLSNLFFVSLHALQYNWDSLLVVFTLGLVFGFLRRRTNTTTSAIAHGTYDFLLILAAALHVPWFSGQ